MSDTNENQHTPESGLPGMTCSPSLARWFCDGGTGSSSLAMASIHLGGKPKRGPTPADPADLNRCLLLLEAAPEIRESFPTIAAHSPQWAALIARWDDVEALFMEECGRNWSKSHTGKLTYRLMREISDGVNDQGHAPAVTNSEPTADAPAVA